MMWLYQSSRSAFCGLDAMNAAWHLRTMKTSSLAAPNFKFDGVDLVGDPIITDAIRRWRQGIVGVAMRISCAVHTCVRLCLWTHTSV